MSLKSVLRKRQSLIWPTKFGTFEDDHSPYFFIVDSAWSLIKKSSSGTYSIILTKNDNNSSCESIPLLEVVTFLEDRRNDALMLCSRITVSSPTETLFKATTDSILKKLPEIALCGDVAVVCTFYPPTVLRLKNEIECLKVRQSLVWETTIPAADEIYRSPGFNLQDQSWYLEMERIDKLSSKTKDSSPIFQVVLRNCSRKGSFVPFEVRTFLENKRNDSQISCSRLTVSPPFEVLYKTNVEDLYEKLPDVKTYGDVSIVCIFGSFAEATLLLKSEMARY